MSDFSCRYRNLAELCDTSVQRFASLPLFGSKTPEGWQWTSYRDFGEQVARARAGLAAAGVNQGDRVAIVSNNRLEWAVSAYATYGLGAVYVPMYENQNPEEWAYITHDCQPTAMVVATPYLLQRLVEVKAALPSPSCTFLIAGDDSAATPYEDLLAMAAAKKRANPAPEETATLIYTSGTTGKPKGVELSHRNIVANVEAAYAILPITSADRSLSFLPWAHCFGQVAELHGMLFCGGSMALAESPQTIIENLSEIRPTVMVSVPRIFNRVYDRVSKTVADSSPVRRSLFKAALRVAKLRQEQQAKGNPSLAVNAAHSVLDRLVCAKVRARLGGRLRFAVSGGAALNPEVAEFVSLIGVRVLQGYGLTETSPVVSVNRFEAAKLGSIGQPLPGVRVRIEGGDEEESETPFPQGELIVYGHCVMKGYYGLPEENARVLLSDGGLRTGDLAYIDDEGFIFITGRIKERYKLENGKYVAPVPLEEELKLSPFILNVMVYGDNKPYNVALIVPDPEALADWARQQALPSTDTKTLVAQPRTASLIRDEVQRLGHKFRRYERIRKFALVAEDFTTDNGMLTPSLKIKRRAVVRQHGPLIEGLYSSAV